MILRFTVPGRIVSWKRATHYQGRKLTPKEQRAYQRLVASVARAAMPRGWQTDMRYAVELVVYAHPQQRFDVDNASKTILDSCNRLVWGDDRQVDALAVVRRIDRDRPRVEVTVAPMTLTERDRVEATIAIGGGA